MQSTALGIAAHMGWVATALVRSEGVAFATLRTDRIALVPPDDRLALEPYHVAGGFDGLARIPRPEDPEATVREGLARQRRHTLAALRTFAREVERAGCELRCAAVLTGRGRPASRIEGALSSHAQIHVEEGLAVRSAVVHALEHLGIEVTTSDERSVADLAGHRVGDGPAAALAFAKRARPPAGAWRREHQLAALAAWLALVGGDG